MSDGGARVIARRTVSAAQTALALLDTGDGPPVVLLHGFPDSAWTWQHQFAPLAEAGHRVAAPFLPGYPPSGMPPGGLIEINAATEALASLIEGLGAPATTIGHDWGAVFAYALAATRPELVSRAAALAVPHPLAAMAVLGSPELIHASFHHWFFQLPDLPEATLAADDLAFVDYLWRLWSPELDDPDHLKRVKRETLAVPGAIDAAIGYYRAMFKEVTSGSFQLPTISCPMLVIFGANDPFQRLAADQGGFFSGPYRFELVSGAGHFVHRERPAEVTRLILDWMTDD